jgi:hypothetical protein
MAEYKAEARGNCRGESVSVQIAFLALTMAGRSGGAAWADSELDA